MVSSDAFVSVRAEIVEGRKVDAAPDQYKKIGNTIVLLRICASA